jgi:hypothetical protein
MKNALGTIIVCTLCIAGCSLGRNPVHMQSQADDVAGDIVYSVKMMLPMTAQSETFDEERHDGIEGGYALYSGDYYYYSGSDIFDSITRRWSDFAIEFHDYASSFGITIESGTLDVSGNSDSDSLYLDGFTIEGTVTISGTYYDEEVRDTVTVDLDCTWSGVIDEGSTLRNDDESWSVWGVWLY